MRCFVRLTLRISLHTSSLSDGSLLIPTESAEMSSPPTNPLAPRQPEDTESSGRPSPPTAPTARKAPMFPNLRAALLNLPTGAGEARGIVPNPPKSSETAPKGTSPSQSGPAPSTSSQTAGNKTSVSKSV
jgi:hypothetical protein